MGDINILFLWALTFQDWIIQCLSFTLTYPISPLTRIFSIGRLFFFYKATQTHLFNGKIISVDPMRAVSKTENPQ